MEDVFRVCLTCFLRLAGYSPFVVTPETPMGLVLPFFAFNTSQDRRTTQPTRIKTPQGPAQTTYQRAKTDLVVSAGAKEFKRTLLNQEGRRKHTQTSGHQPLTRKPGVSGGLPKNPRK